MSFYRTFAKNTGVYDFLWRNTEHFQMNRIKMHSYLEVVLKKYLIFQISGAFIPDFSKKSVQDNSFLQNCFRNYQIFIPYISCICCFSCSRTFNIVLSLATNDMRQLTTRFQFHLNPMIVVNKTNYSKLMSTHRHKWRYD